MKDGRIVKNITPGYTSRHDGISVMFNPEDGSTFTWDKQGDRIAFFPPIAGEWPGDPKLTVHRHGRTILGSRWGNPAEGGMEGEIVSRCILTGRRAASSPLSH